MVETRRLSRLLTEIAARTCPPPGPVVVALSGGADSAALAGWLVRSGVTVRALHIHHGLAASDRLEETARSAAGFLGIGFTSDGIEPGPGPGFEARARAARYACFDRHLTAGEQLATGHTLDDLTETVLMRLGRGAGLDGLSGIAEQRRPYLRPLLRVRRSETRELASLMGLPWMDDPSNESQDALRNRVRSILMPALEATFGRDPSVALALSALQLQEERRFLDDLVDDGGLMTGQGWVSIPATALTGLEPALASRLLRRMWHLLGFEYPPGSKSVARALEVAGGGWSSTQLGNGVTARVEQERFVMRRAGSATDGATG
jgi:tRNA(Ile)-lysidine synthase